MKKLINHKVFSILIPIFILMVFSILNMMNAGLIMEQYSNYYFKQILWFVIGFIILIALANVNTKYIFKYSYIFYIVNVILLILVLFLGINVNGTNAWFDLKYFSYQPSETMKLALILFLSNIVQNAKLNNLKDEFVLILKVLVVTLIPSILTFLEPDTGAVIIYAIIALAVLFASFIKYRWFIIAGIIIVLLGIGFFYFYTNYQNKFIDIFGTSFFYRMDRLFEFGKGLQIENALIAVGSAGLVGSGIKTVPIYFPESPTDFVFALSISNFGFIGGILIILTYVALFIFLIRLLKNINKKENKIFIVGFTSMFIFQTIQNILMNLGILPIIGITLPFISYGGTSTILYFICIGIILKIIYEKEKYPYRIF